MATEQDRHPHGAGTHDSADVPGAWQGHLRAILGGTLLGAAIGGALLLWREPEHGPATHAEKSAPAAQGATAPHGSTPPPAPHGAPAKAAAAAPTIVNAPATASSPPPTLPAGTASETATPLRAVRLAAPGAAVASYTPEARVVRPPGASGTATAAGSAQAKAPLARSPPEAPSSPVVLTPTEEAGLARLPELRKAAREAARRLADSTPRDASALALSVALRGEPRPLTATDVVGSWRCRSLTFDGKAVAAQGFSRCGIVRKGDGYRLSKLAGKERKLGQLEPIDGQTLRYVGATSFDVRAINDASIADLPHEDVGQLVMPATRRLRLELPKADGALEVVELTR